MPALSFLAVVGLALVALLFVANATLEIGPPPIVTSDHYGLPKPWYPGTMQNLTTARAPAPDMSSPAILAAQPKASPEAATKIDAAARAARAEAPPKKKRITHVRQIFH